ncbi:hypothetical protein niasHT_016347 [Heterodera trifolii]|uniref:Angiotensin-converting enzyme n=1 Tax=Heterodera trifolii TaxID=157864 RepID=A0ABD2KZ21_9BILA
MCAFISCAPSLLNRFAAYSHSSKFIRRPIESCSCPLPPSPANADMPKNRSSGRSRVFRQNDRLLGRHIKPSIGVHNYSLFTLRVHCSVVLLLLIMFSSRSSSSFSSSSSSSSSSSFSPSFSSFPSFGSFFLPMLFLLLSPGLRFDHRRHHSLLSVCSASPPGVNLEDVSADEDYSVLVEQETNKPADVDNDVIQSLVDNFLNKGTAVDGVPPPVGPEQPEKTDAEPLKLNKEAQALVNSSDFWRTTNLEPSESISDPSRVQAWLNGYSSELQRVLQQIAQAGWNYFASASFTTKQYLDEAEEVGRAFLRASTLQSRQFNASVFPLGSAQRVQLSILAQQGMNSLEARDLHEFNRILLAINQQFTHTQLCGEPGKVPTAGDKATCLLKFPDLPSMLYSQNTGTNQCLELWQKWRLSAGSNLTQSYAELIELSNKGAKLNGYSDAGAMWRSVYELPAQFGFYSASQIDISRQMDILYSQLAPLYQQLHAYFRARLAAVYAQKANEDSEKGGQQLSRDGPLPIHLLKSLSGDSWTVHYEQTKPFPEEMPAEEQKIANEMVDSFRAQNYTVRTMFSKVYRFMKFVGFERLPRTFWTSSIFTRNWSKDMICNPATAYNMMNGQQDDYRVKVCAQLSEQDFVNAHRLLAKLYYQYGSRTQPILLRDAPNPSLSAALAGAFGIVALHPDYLRAQKLVSEKTERNAEAEVNRLYREALEDIVKLPFAIVADKWRYAAFEGRINASNWSKEWWQLRQHYQGIVAPPMADPRSVEFDAVASPAIGQQHAPATRDALAYVIQFQILKKLCGGVDQLSDGCMPNQTTAKSVLEAIAQGGSISWLDAFEKLTGTRQLDAGPLLEYYAPLLAWLKRTNEAEQRVIGWDKSKGELFTDNELPVLKAHFESDNAFGSGIMSPDGGGVGMAGGEGAPIAFPGQSCTSGQECLLDSHCNGTICVCREGLFTLRIADSYNCVPGDPAKVGFTDDNGGLVIALNPNNETDATDSAANNEQNVVVRPNANDQNDRTVNRASQLLYTPLWWLGILALLSMTFCTNH